MTNKDAIVAVVIAVTGACGFIGFFAFAKDGMQAAAVAESLRKRVAQAPVTRVCRDGTLVRAVDGRAYVDGRGRGGWAAEGIAQERLCDA